MKKILDLIRVDIITMNGDKNSLKTVFVLMFFLCVVMGFLFSPTLGLLGPLLMAAFFVPMLFQNELKYHSEKLHSLLPINRRDLVRARFLLAIGLYVVLFLIFYLLMLLSMKLKVYALILTDDMEFDRITYLAESSGGALSVLGLFNLLYFSAFSIGIAGITGELRKYFKNSESFSGSLTFNTKKETRRKEFIAALIVIGIMVFWILVISDILPILSALLPILVILLQLAEAANGFLLSAVMVTIAIFSAIYKYICTVLEYDDKEL